MEIIIPNTCIKCGNNLTKDEKKMGLPICQNCINSLLGLVTDKIKSDSKRYDEEVDNFSKFIISSGELFKLDDICIIQCSFNVFMSKITKLIRNNPKIGVKIINDSIGFMKNEINETEETSFNNRFVGTIDELIRKENKEREEKNKEKNKYDKNKN
jgi:predicted  nucleic acid-binding Zn-ribbon protein